VEEIVYLENGSLFVIPARLSCLAREESRNPGPFARQPRARVTNAECVLPNHLYCALQTRDTSHFSRLIGVRQNGRSITT
jgi:hypothetical protein